MLLLDRHTTSLHCHRFLANLGWLDVSILCSKAASHVQPISVSSFTGYSRTKLLANKHLAWTKPTGHPLEMSLWHQSKYHWRSCDISIPFVKHWNVALPIVSPSPKLKLQHVASCTLQHHADAPQLTVLHDAEQRRLYLPGYWWMNVDDFKGWVLPLNSPGWLLVVCEGSIF